VHVLQLAVAPADGRTDGLDDHGFTHFLVSFIPREIGGCAEISRGPRMNVADFVAILRVASNAHWEAVSTPQIFAWLADFFGC
jgi:hypothetical protein